MSIPLALRLRAPGFRDAFVGLLLLALAGCAAAPPPPPRPAPIPRPAIELLGTVALPPDDGSGARLGGLSGLSWAGGDRFLAISDDKADHGPVRFYRLEVAWDGALAVAAPSWVELRDRSGGPLAGEGSDCEGIAVDPSGGVWVSSEGWVERLLPPFVARFDGDGRWLEELSLPAGFAPTADGLQGVRDNQALEALDLTPDGRYLFVGTENALVQDGPSTYDGVASPSRLLRYDLERRRWDGAWVYLVEPPHAEPLPGQLRVGGLVEIVALDRENLLAMERSFVRDRGHRVRIFRVRLAGADEIAGIAALADAPRPRPVAKELLLDFDELGIEMDNYEGMALGRELADGRRLLVVVSDDNFSPRQANRVLVFAVDPAVL
ncbi:MAG: esterase-like activity of phytase family protein [Thermoanaerobaculia bacterium]|nr:esterase-like activity of phytase family protein [Thermoanaerobaculia bacterium]